MYLLLGYLIKMHETFTHVTFGPIRSKSSYEICLKWKIKFLLANEYHLIIFQMEIAILAEPCSRFSQKGGHMVDGNAYYWWCEACDH